MNRILFAPGGRLRNGWWMLVFALGIVATGAAYTPLSKALQAQGVDTAWLAPVPIVLVLLVTWTCQRLRGESLAAVGLRIDRIWWRQAIAGCVAGGVLMLAITGLIALSGGVRFAPDPARSAFALAFGAWTLLWVAWLEELLFRGFLFQRMVDGVGAAGAQAAFALLFAAAHWGNPGMEGATQFWASLDIALGAVLLGLAWLCTRSLALPIGLHFGWNWMQGSVLGFDISGVDAAGWWLPVLGDRPQWITGGGFGPEASVFAVGADLVAIALLWRWAGRRRGSVAGGAPGVPHPAT